ncbi:MAG: sensor domain-containing diguanylate cyclase [Armatimonadota bacterium]
MEEISGGAKKFIIIKFLIALILGVLLFYKILGSVSPPSSGLGSFIFLLIIALAFEITSFRVGFFGSINPAFVIYFTVLIVFGPQMAILAVLINSVFRALIVNYSNSWFRLADFSDTFLIIIFTGTIYYITNASAAFLSLGNIISLIVIAVVYMLMDYLLPAIFIGMYFPDKQKIWNLAKNKAGFVSIAVIPLAVATTMLYMKGPYFTAFIIPVLLAVRYMQGISVHVAEVKSQEAAEGRMNYLEAELHKIKESNISLDNTLQKKIDELSIFFELGHVLGANLTLESVLNNVIYMIRRLIFCQSCVIYLYNKEKELIPYKYSTPYKEVLEASNLLKLEEKVVEVVADKNKPVLVGNMDTSSEHRIFKDEASIMGIPLIIQNKLIGVIYIGAKNPNSFTTEHLESVSNLATASAIAIKSALLFEAQEEALKVQQRINEQLDIKVKEISMISDFGKTLGTTLHLKETLKIIGDATKSMLNYQTCVIFKLEGEADQAKFVPEHIISPHEDYFKDTKLDPKKGLLGWIYTNRKVLLLEDAKESILENLTEEEQSIIAAPLIVENQIIGAVYFGATLPYSFNGDQLGLVVSVAYQAAMAIQNAEFYEKIAALAITDGITGLYTHRYFQERLEESLKWSQRYNKPVSLIFIDLDHFKQFNDTLGHPAGDKVLSEIAVMLRTYTRESDFVCRYGGDEFSLVLVGQSKEEAAMIAERIREGFFQHVNKYPVQITGSIGVSTYPDDASSKVDLIFKADLSTYKSKHEGKNRVTLA